MLENLPINISPTGRPQWHTPAEIRAAAAEGLHINYNAGRGEAGSIIRAWAGEFTVAGEVRS